MCFKTKVKTPKTNPEALKAPEPVLLSEPKGVDFGSTTDNQSDPTGIDSLKVSKTSSTDKGDGSSSATAKDTGFMSPVKRALKKVTK